MSFLTTITSAFKGGGSTRVPIARGFASPWASALESHAPPFDYATSLQAGYASNPVAQRAVRIVAEGVGAAPVSTDADDLLALVTAPSAGQSLVETIAAHLLLHGSLPTERQLRAYKAALALHRALPAEVRVAKRWLRARVQGGHQSARVRENRA